MFMSKFFVDYFTDDDKKRFLSIMKDSYFSQIEYIGADKEDNIFSWSNNSLNLYMIKISNGLRPINESYNQILVFATKSSDDNIISIDLSNETYSYEFQKNNSIFFVMNLLKLLIYKNILSINSDSIIYNSVFLYTNITKDFFKKDVLEKFGSDFASKEYDSSNDFLSNKTVSSISFDKNQFFANKYKFSDMLNTINDNQLNIELGECLEAYNHGNWFICATGLGSVIEHIMLLTIIKYNSSKMFKKLGKQPTLFNYLNAFKEDPINISYKQELYIRTLFQFRNCVDHYSTGYTNKNLVDSLLNGVRNIFNDYYVPSINTN